jgi:hypothetical protein
MTGLKLASLKADLAREEEGDWVESVAFPGVAFKVCSLNARAYTVARDTLLMRLRLRFNGQPVPPDVQAKEFGGLYCAHILRDWRGLDVPYSGEKAEEVLCDPAYRAVLKEVEVCAARLGAIMPELIEADVKN